MRIANLVPSATEMCFALGLEHRRNPLDHGGQLLGVGAAAGAEHVVGSRHAELGEEDLRHVAVVVLAGVDEHVVAVGVELARGGDQRRHLDEVRPRRDHVQEAHPASV